MGRLQERYTKEIRPKLQEEFGFYSSHSVPRPANIPVNMGIGKAR